MLRCPSCQAAAIDLPSWALPLRREPVVCPQCGSRSRPAYGGLRWPIGFLATACILFYALFGYAQTLDRPDFMIGAAMVLSSAGALASAFWLLVAALNLRLTAA